MFISSKPFSQLLNISPTNHIYTETLYLHFSYIKVWFTFQNSMPLEIEDRYIWICYVWIYFGFSSFGKNMDKSLRSKYRQKIAENTKKLANNALKTASKRAIQKATEATCDLFENKIVEKITKATWKSIYSWGSKKMDGRVIRWSVNIVNRDTKKKDKYHQKNCSKLLMNLFNCNCKYIEREWSTKRS